MDRQTQQSVVISLVIHGAFILLALAFLLAEKWLRQPEPLVFELVAAAAPPAPARPTEAPEPDPALEPLRVAQADPLRPVPDLPELPEPPPEPPPETEPLPTPPPEPVRTLSYEEWVRNRTLPERVQRVQQAPRQPVRAVPEIETDVRSRLEQQLSPIQIQGVDLSRIQSADALQRYLAELRQRIQEVFSPSGSGLEAEAYFTVSAAGRLVGAQIHRSSGNPGFDQSVLRTLRSARTPGPPPGNRDYTFSLVFRSE